MGKILFLWLLVRKIVMIFMVISIRNQEITKKKKKRWFQECDVTENFQIGADFLGHCGGREE